MSYARADNPKIALAVTVENAGHGSEIAAPISRDFIREYFRPGRLMQGPKMETTAKEPQDKPIPIAGTGSGGEQ